jgi:NitT/TauT family transport system substrate-binding protein
MDRRHVLGAAALWLSICSSSATAQVAKAPEKKSITIGVGGRSVFYYLPLTIAETRGFFKEEGLEVTINDFAGGAKALQAMLGGSVDVVTGSYEHTINMQAKNQDIRALVVLARNSMVLVANKARGGGISTVAELKGKKIGVSAPGSSTHFFVLYLMAKSGLTAADASFISVGASAGAVASLETGELDALSNVDPVITKLQSDGKVNVLADARSLEGSRRIFGATPPAAVLYASKKFIDQNPETTQRLVNAFMKALNWIGKSSAEEIANAVPHEYWLGDKALYMRALQANLTTYGKTGVASIADRQATLDMLMSFDPTLSRTKIDLSKTFDDSFVNRVPK